MEATDDLMLAAIPSSASYYQKDARIMNNSLLVPRFPSASIFQFIQLLRSSTSHCMGVTGTTH